MAKRISSGEPKPRRTPARRRVEKTAAEAPVPNVVEPVEPVMKAAPVARDGAKPDPNAVARRAFELFLARGGVHGHDVEDWVAAERELKRRS